VTLRIYPPCRAPRCDKHAVGKSNFCEAHQSHDTRRTQQNANDRERYRQQPERQFEKSWAWRKHSKLVRDKNPICQATDNGVRCEQQSRIVHHLHGPGDDWHSRFGWDVLVATCYEHHITTPGDAGKYNYAPTVGMDGKEYPHPDIGPHPSMWTAPRDPMEGLRRPTPVQPTAEQLDDVFGPAKQATTI
jgi:hypothetical protein